MSQQQTECQAQQYAHYNSKLSSDQLRKPGAYKWTACKMRPVTQQSMKDPHEAAEDTSTTPRCRKHPHCKYNQSSQRGTAEQWSEGVTPCGNPVFKWQGGLPQKEHAPADLHKSSAWNA